MILASDAVLAAKSRFARKTPAGGAIWRTEFFGPPPSPASATSVDEDAGNALIYADPAPGEVRLPQAFLVEQEAGALVKPHFHFVDQFQIVVDGDGSFGRHAVQPITAHFASACTAYGPIVPGPEGLKYFSLRASADSTGAQFVPAAKDKMRKLPKRHMLSERIAVSAPDALSAMPAAVLETVKAEPDGLAVLMLRAPPSTVCALPDPRQGGGQSLIVAAGAIAHEGAAMGRWSALFVSCDEPAYEVHAGPAGAEVLVLQYPRPG
ncbi:MAG: hypothetical protein ACHQF3_00365 [Alphaproteobacteria bacterium]